MTGIFVDQYNALGLAVFLIVIQAMIMDGINIVIRVWLNIPDVAASCPMSGPKTEIESLHTSGTSQVWNFGPCIQWRRIRMACICQNYSKRRWFYRHLDLRKA
jgi:hypothetical protein